MRKAVFLAAVREDLLSILEYIADASGSLATAERFVRTLRARCHALAALETMVGRLRPELGDGIRSSPFRGYIIFFRYRSDRFEVISIMEEHRDALSRFEPRDP